MDPDDAIDDWAARAARQTALSAELSERLRQARASAESHRGEVVVTVDHSGGLAGLSLGEQAMRLPAGDLSELILATSRQAQANLARQISSLVSTVYGPGSETALFIGQAYTEQFPQPEPEDEEGERR